MQYSTYKYTIQRLSDNHILLPWLWYRRPFSEIKQQKKLTKSLALMVTFFMDLNHQPETSLRKKAGSVPFTWLSLGKF